MMSVEEQWVRLIEEISDALHAALRSACRARARRGTGMPVFLAFSFFRQLKIPAQLCYYPRSILKEPAQILVRALLECRFKFDLFFLRFLRDPKETVTLILDAMMLEKIRQAKLTDFAGLDLIPGAPTPNDFRQHEKEIRERRSQPEFEKLKKYGFSQMSVEQRARELHHSQIYNIVYRNFSRNVHGSDYAECLSRDLELRTVPYTTYIQVRDNTSLSTVAWCGLGILDVTVRYFRFPMLRKVASLRKRVNKLNGQRPRSR